MAQLFAPSPLVPGARFRNLLAYVHGDGRRFQYLLESLRDFSRRNSVMILAPLFPADLFGDGATDGYKVLRERGIYYDEILLDMVATVRELFVFDDERFLLGGFSGGGQFAHRFAYLHARSLRAVSIAAPSTVTLLDEAVPWWEGVSDVEAVLGRSIDAEGLLTLPFHLIVGERDKGEETNLLGPEDKKRDRVARLESLERSLKARGLDVDFDVAPNAGHEFTALLPSTEAFFDRFVRPLEPDEPLPLD